MSDVGQRHSGSEDSLEIAHRLTRYQITARRVRNTDASVPGCGTCIDADLEGIRVHTDEPGPTIVNITYNPILRAVSARVGVAVVHRAYWQYASGEKTR